MRGTATYAQALQSVPETQVSQLDNGLRVASEQSSQPTCTVSGCCREGASILGPVSFPRSGCDLGLYGLGQTLSHLED